MGKFKSLAFAALTTVVITACSSGKTEVEQASEQELQNKVQEYLQKNDYRDAQRYLEALDTRFAGGTYAEQTKLNLIYTAYKTDDYTQALVVADKFLQSYPNSQYLDYVLYMAALSNMAMGDNFVQDALKVDRSTRETTTSKTAFANFQTLVKHFPNSPYAADAIARMAYIKDMLARHELKITQFYADRKAWVAVSNRVTGMLQSYPDTASTLKALPLLKKAYEEMGLTDLANQTETLIQANQGKNITEAEKPSKPLLSLPSWLKF